MCTNNIMFHSEEASISIIIDKESINCMYQLCNESYPNETGGILVGQYLDKVTAEIIIVLEPSNDSRSGKANFIRGTKGINKLLKEYWKQGLYYLGEWHFHPNGISSPSKIDMETMKSIASNLIYNCPEPILTIVSGSYDNYNQKCYLFSKDIYNLELNQL